MPLIKNKGQVAKYLTISDANTDGSIPKQRGAENEFIIPVLGQELFDMLQAEADSLPSSPSTLLDLTLNALVFLAYYKELPFLHGKISDTGIMNTSTANQTVAYRYQYYNMLDNLENEGLAGIEKLLQYLFENKDDYPEWEASAVFERLNNNLIKTGSDFTRYFHIYQPHRTFYTLQPVMQEVEDFYIVSKIGKDFFNELKDAVNPTADQAQLLELLRKAIANFTIFKAASKLSVKVSAEGFTVMLSRNPDRPDQGEENAPALQVNKVADSAAQDGNVYLSQAIDLLNSLASNTVFTTFFTSKYYTDPNKVNVDLNDSMCGVYAF